MVKTAAKIGIIIQSSKYFLYFLSSWSVIDNIRKRKPIIFCTMTAIRGRTLERTYR